MKLVYLVLKSIWEFQESCETTPVFDFSRET